MNSLTIALWITLISLISFGSLKVTPPENVDVQFDSSLGDTDDHADLNP